jgi:hypothetical protein
LPVLAAVPAILLEPDRAMRARRAVRQGLVAAAVTIVCLLGGFATYLYVNGLPALLTGPAPAEQTTEVKRGDQAFVVVEGAARS